MTTLTQSAEDMYGTLMLHGDVYECNTVLFNINSGRESDSEVIKVIKEYEKTNEELIEKSDVDVLRLLRQATTLCSGVNKGYLLDVYETTDICVMLFSRSVTDMELRSKHIIENLCGFMFLDTKRSKKERSIYVNLICTSKGFGSKLLKFAEQISISLGYNRVTLSSLDSPLGFYLKKGYTFRNKRNPTVYEISNDTEELYPVKSKIEKFESSNDLTLQPLRGMLYNEKRSNGAHFWIYTQSRGDSSYDRRNWTYIKPGNLLLFKRVVGPDGNVFYNFDAGLYEKIKQYLDPSEISINCFSAHDENGSKHSIKINGSGGLITVLRNIDFIPDGGIFMYKNLAPAPAPVSASNSRTTSVMRTKLGSKKSKKSKNRRLSTIKMSLKVGN